MKTAAFFLIFIAALYFGTGGYVILQNEQMYENALKLEKKEVEYKGTTYHNYELYRMVRQYGLILKVFPYTQHIPTGVSFIITAMAFGVVGAIGRVINDTIRAKQKLNQTANLLLITAHGAIIGVVILGISYSIPMLLTGENIPLKPITVVFICLLGGIIYDNFYTWFIGAISKLINKKSEEK
ncbi:hypothetical protein [Alistipes sp. ZOR0009]|jgi:hypothetical protein|uniref:hypothetical protein n=1 Tax=Alistipes sp. ZOR0009 TaxID=1339253 RepID=UPI0006487B41|nr:hypothetical protein [Alistipes sp. ZOR0009]